ncbi:MAG: hypothetical protein ACREL5_07715 [Gemmatimonadales bacterium]
MKLNVAIAVILLASSMQAQIPVPPSVNNMEEVHKPELRVGVVTGSALRISISDSAGPVHASTSVSGGELFARTDNIAVFVRSVSGSYPGTPAVLSGNYLSQEADLIIGAQVFSVEGGYVRRSTSGQDPHNRESFWRAGLRSTWDIGSSGVQVVLRAAGRFGNAPTKDGTNGMQFLGIDGEASMLVQAPRGIPIYGLAGWRYERFDDAWSTDGRTEEASGPYFSVGVRFASKPFLR